MNNDRAIFIGAIRADASLPHAVREQAAAVQGFERCVFDQSYLDFLLEQIDLEPRGPEWTAILTARLTAISRFCGVPTLYGCIHTPTGICYVRVDPSSQSVIHHEERE
ncbi:MAG: hypothetical protein J0M24_03750 [Verrucomicrobia bacterium]|nr:hypothetical protein [Verrucomicrobiota bacterium]MBN9689331.1 hypothetical protein [Verrucomicrobiota bacterium]